MLPDPEDNLINKTIEELKIEKIDVQEPVTFVKDLIASDAHPANAEIKAMLDSLVFILEQLDALYNQLTGYQQSKKSDDLMQTLKILIEPYGKIKWKLLSAIEQSGLIFENHFDREKQKTQKKPTSENSLTGDSSKQEIYGEQPVQGFKPSKEITLELRAAILNNDRGWVLDIIKGNNIDVNQLEADGLAPLHFACLKHKADAISALLERNANTNLYSKLGFTPLHYALLNKCADKQMQLNIINTLLQKLYSTDVNAKARSDYSYSFSYGVFNGWTALHFAARLGITDLVQALINNRAKINVLSFNDETPLYLAAAGGFVDIVKILKDNGAALAIGRTPFSPAIKTNDSTVTIGHSPFYPVITNGYIDILDMFLKIKNPFPQTRTDAALLMAQKAANYVKTKNDSDYVYPSATSFFDCYLLLFTWPIGELGTLIWGENCRPVHEVILEMLAERFENPVDVDHAKITVKITQKLLDRQDAQNRIWLANILMPHAVHNNLNIDLIDLLLGYGAGLQAAFSIALKWTNNEACLRFLIKRGAKADKSVLGIEKHYCTRHPVHEAADAGDVPRLRALLEQYGAAGVNDEDHHHATPVHIAASKGDLEVLMALTEKLACIKTATRFGVLPLHCAAFNGHTPIVSYLLRSNDDKVATINQQNIHGLTPLHAAIMAGKVDTALLLLKEGADTTTKSARKLTPLEYAFMNSKSRNYFHPSLTIPGIIEQHRTSNEQAENSDQIINIGETFPTLAMTGDIVQSLQQVHQGQDTSYCGYYALYNALSLLQINTDSFPDSVRLALKFGTFEKNDRKKFSEFFAWTLDSISKKRKIGSLGSLLPIELQHLVAIICPTAPIVVLEKKQLKDIADGIIQPDQMYQQIEQLCTDEAVRKASRKNKRENWNYCEDFQAVN